MMQSEDSRRISSLIIRQNVSGIMLSLKEESIPAGSKYIKGRFFLKKREHIAKSKEK